MTEPTEWPKKYLVVFDALSKRECPIVALERREVESLNNVDSVLTTAGGDLINFAHVHKLELMP